MNFHKLLAKLEGLDDRCAEFVAAGIVNEVSEWAAKNGYPDLVREWTPAAQPIEVRRYLAAAIAATKTQVPEPSTEDYFTVKQVAEKLQISERSVARMIDKGLTTVKVGKSIRIKPADLEQFLSDQETVFD
ncbi:helix-turn-helix domain-containing protein [Lacipirellula sp.]|uniref:helix-turn-helix domain-containing protein n=1 Tax=Lacipirellula sp. TaxID=2691419 RepID=UPI003D0CE727